LVLGIPALAAALERSRRVRQLAVAKQLSEDGYAAEISGRYGPEFSRAA